MSEEKIVVVAGVILKEGKFFLVRRPLHKKDGGLWEFPGGKVEAGEDLLDSLKRELKEELDLEVLEGEVLAKIEKEKEGKIYEFVFIKVKKYLNEIKLREAEEAGFFTKDEALKLELCQPDREFLETFCFLPIKR